MRKREARNKRGQRALASLTCAVRLSYTGCDMVVADSETHGLRGTLCFSAERVQNASVVGESQDFRRV